MSTFRNTHFEVCFWLQGKIYIKRGFIQFCTRASIIQSLLHATAHNRQQFAATGSLNLSPGRISSCWRWRRLSLRLMSRAGGAFPSSLRFVAPAALTGKRAHWSLLMEPWLKWFPRLAACTSHPIWLLIGGLGRTSRHQHRCRLRGRLRAADRRGEWREAD